MFMSDGPNTAAPPPTDPPVTGSGRLLGLVRRLIDYGNTLLATLRQQPSPEALFDISRCFGTLDAALIIARIIRGLRLAAALQDRLVRNSHRLDKPRASVAASRPPRRSGPACPRPAPHPADAADLAALPTPEEIAAKIRRRPIGAVLADICSDLGITANHPLWRDLHQAVMRHGGSCLRMIRDLFHRVRLTNFIPPDTPLDPLSLLSPQDVAPSTSLATGTGPP